MADDEKRKKKRTTLRTLTTRICNSAQAVFDDENLNIDEKMQKLQEIRDQLDKKQNDLKDIDEEIENSIDIEDIENEIFVSEEYQEKIIKYKSKISWFLKDKERREGTESNGNLNKSVEIEDRERKGSHEKQNSVSLPRIEIVPYDGQIEKWQSFWSQFNSAINECTSLNKVQKMNYLKSLLVGSALNSIQGLDISEVNYDIALSILKERYGKEDLIISSHINRLLKLTPVKRSFYLKELRALYDDCIMQVRCLDSYGIQINSFGNLLFPILAQLIPEDIVLEFNRTQKDKNWDVTELLEFLRAEIEGRERLNLLRVRYDDKPIIDIKSATFNHEKNKMKENWPKYFDKSKRIPTSAALNTTSKSLCIFCSQEHEDINKCKLTIVEKRKSLLRQGRCFNCLLKYHRCSTCNSKTRCKFCNEKHSYLLCENEKENKQNDAPSTLVSAVHDSRSEVLLQTATAIAENESKSFQIRLICDTGSEKTFIDEKLSKKLKLKAIGKEALMIYTFGSNKPEKHIRKRVLITLRDARNTKKKITFQAIEVPCISAAPIWPPSKQTRAFCSDRNMTLADIGEERIGIESFDDSANISLLIGSDVYWRVFYGNVRRLPNALTAMNSVFGWILNGPCMSASVGKGEVKNMKILARINGDFDESVSDGIRQFWELESLGIVDNKNESAHKEQKIILSEFEKGIQFIEGRYEVKLPFNENVDNLDDNYSNARARFWKLIARFRKDKSLFESYGAVVNRHISEGIVEKVEPQLTDVEGKYYMPHQAVVREDKSTTKVRVVFDASSSSTNSISLNDCLNSGPNLNPDILSVLLTFRWHAVAILGDIEQAFLQVSLAPSDRKFVRFLWLKEHSNLEDMLEPDIYQITRCPFGVTSCPFLLAATIKHHIKKYEHNHPEAYKMLNTEMYVDDLVSGQDNVVDASKRRMEIKMILRDAGFNIRKFTTNINSMRKEWSEEENTNYSEKSKVLGYIWNPDKDTLEIEAGKMLSGLKKETTKREVLRIAGRIFDPIGFISPFTVRIKMMFQEIWQRKLKWDELLPPDLLKEWQKWCEELHMIDQIKIHRHYFSSMSLKENTNLQLHCFVDSSKKAYGAVIYICYNDSENVVRSALVASKSRVSPLHEITLPRLELLAAVIGVRLYSLVRERLPASMKMTPYFWTDSMIVLHWIQGCSKKLKTFVRNRVSEIKALTAASSWGHCCSEENPADFLSRGQQLGRLLKNEMWWCGPVWLKEAKNQWPSTSTMLCHADETEIAPVFFTGSNTDNLFELERFGNLNRMLRITSWVLRFVYNIKNNNVKLFGALTAEELNCAEDYWIKKTQEYSFPDEFRCLIDGKAISSTSKLLGFNPFLDGTGILRIGGRLQFSNLSYEEKHPIILPDQNHFTELVIDRSHIRTGHGGVSDTLIEVRERFWILKGRQRVKSFVFKCNLCKKFRTKPATQDMASLPPDRVREAFPFEVTGLDYLGPLYVKEEGVIKKSYVLLFTCAVTRAVHLELTRDLSAPVFLQAFKKFIARRGLCKTIWSDNAKTFKKAKKELEVLQKCLQDHETQSYFSRQRIHWKFIVERAAWWGGFWERLVRSVKAPLKRILGKSSLSFSELETIVIEVEAILNSRPLTYVYSDENECEPLTPGHFLIGRRLISLPGSSTQPPSSESTLLRKHRHQRQLLDSLWRRWKKEYLLELRSAVQTSTAKNPTKLKEGMIVQIFEEKTPKMMWQVGVIKELHQGRDGKTRACTIRLPKGTVLKRPVQLLYPLELSI